MLYEDTILIRKLMVSVATHGHATSYGKNMKVSEVL
jgi:hypothetical protein